MFSASSAASSASSRWAVSKAQPANATSGNRSTDSALNSHSQPTSDTFIKFGSTQSSTEATSTSTLRHDPVYDKHELRLSVAKEADLDELAQVANGYLSGADGLELEMLEHSFSRCSPDMKKAYMKKCCGDPLPDGTAFETVWPHLLKLVDQPGGFTKLINQGRDEHGQIPKAEGELKKLLSERYVHNPLGAILMLRNKEGKIVAIEGISQLLPSHEIHFDLGLRDPIDRKHGLVSFLYVLPEERGKGLAKALKKSTYRYARDAMGYRYLWSPTVEGNASRAINDKMGYKPLAPDTRFDDCPVFDTALNTQLMAEYNTSKNCMAYLDTHAPDVADQLADPV